MESYTINYGEQFIDEDFMKAVGRLTINFAHLEFIISLICGSKMNTTYPINEIVTSELSFRQLVNITLAIIKSVDTNNDRVEHINRLLKTATELEQRRNAITHSFYGTYEETNTVIRHKNTAKGKAGFKRQSEITSASGINCIADELADVSSKLAITLFAISAEEAEKL